MSYIPAWFGAQLTILTGIVDGVLLTYMLFPPDSSYTDLFFGLGLTGQFALSFLATYLAWWRHLAPSQKEWGEWKEFCGSIGKAFSWASGPLAITLFFMIVSFIAIAVIPYIEKDMPISMYKLVATLSTTIYYLSLWLRYIFEKKARDEEPKPGSGPRELEEVVVA